MNQRFGPRNRLVQPSSDAESACYRAGFDDGRESADSPRPEEREQSTLRVLRDTLSDETVSDAMRVTLAVEIVSAALSDHGSEGFDVVTGPDGLPSIVQRDHGSEG